MTDEALVVRNIGVARGVDGDAELFVKLGYRRAVAGNGAGGPGPAPAGHEAVGDGYAEDGYADVIVVVSDKRVRVPRRHSHHLAEPGAGA